MSGSPRSAADRPLSQPQDLPGGEVAAAPHHDPAARGACSDPGLREEFRAKVLSHYERHGRRMPWRDDTSPYSIFISEIMLQQTQVSRVEKYYEAFRSRFPDFCSLASSPLAELLAAWKGLGYNRRALNMRAAARMICEDYGGLLPADPTELVKLPGIGKNTAGSICAFAFNLPVAFIETNIRRVFIHHFFPGEEKVPDARLLPCIEACLPQGKSRIWYWALMDYGVSLREVGRKAARRSSGHRPQSSFEGSVRQMRAGILHLLTGLGSADEDMLETAINQELPGHPGGREVYRMCLEALGKEGFICRDSSGRYRIAD